MRKLLTCTLVALFCSTLTFARWDRLPQGKWWEKPQVVQRLGLTKEQQKSINDVFVAHMNTMIDLKAEVEKKELALNELLNQEKPSEKALMKAVDALINARMNLERERASMHIKVRVILNKEQWDQLRLGFRKHMKERIRKRLEKMPRREKPDMGGHPMAPPPPQEEPYHE